MKVSLKTPGKQGPQGAAAPDPQNAVNGAPVELRTLWSTMPGWCTAADLIPPELVDARRLAVLRRQMIAGLLLLVVLCAGGFFVTAHNNTLAAADLATAQDRTLQLQREARSYSGVVQIQGSVTLVQSQIAQVMVGDVDLVSLMGKLQANLPKTMTISQESIVISPAGVADGSAAGSGGLDTSGLPRIGTITLTGSGTTLDDLSTYVDRLSAIAGLVDVVPVSNTKSAAGAGTQYNLRIGLTNVLLSHRFDVAPVTK